MKSLLLTLSATAAIGLAASAEASLLTYDDLSDTTGSAGVGTNGQSLHGAAGGAGWQVGWSVEGNNINTYAFKSATPLTYQTGSQTLATTAQYAAGGGSFQRAYRRLDVTNGSVWANNNSVTNPTGNAKIDKGTVYASWLVRRDVDVASYYSLTGFTDVAPSSLNGKVKIRVEFAANETINVAYKTADLADSTAYTILNTGKTSSVGHTDLVVIGIDYGDGTTDASLKIWINPTSLGGVEPAADISASDMIPGWTANDFTKGSGFSTLAVRPSDNLNQGSFDELRFGTTYADVTPIPEPATLGLLAIGGLLMVHRSKR